MIAIGVWIAALPERRVVQIFMDVTKPTEFTAICVEQQPDHSGSEKARGSGRTMQEALNVCGRKLGTAG